jgi:Tfp pilus assembly protein PilZ
MAVRVLLVSSDIEVIETLCFFTDQMAMQVELCSDIGTATRKLCHGKFEGVIVDFKKTEEPLVFVKKLRETTSHRGAIALAILNCPQEIPAAFRAGASFTLVRPLTSTMVARTLRASYPSMVLQKRRHFRCPVRVPVQIRCDSGTELVATSTNLSEGGMALVAKTAPTIGDKVELRMTLPGKEKQEKIRAQVQWSNAAGLMGVEFVDLPTSVRDRLQSWLGDRLQESLRQEFSLT